MTGVVLVLERLVPFGNWLDGSLACETFRPVVVAVLE
jgi:hypothetical protein